MGCGDAMVCGGAFLGPTRGVARAHGIAAARGIAGAHGVAGAHGTTAVRGTAASHGVATPHGMAGGPATLGGAAALWTPAMPWPAKAPCSAAMPLAAAMPWKTHVLLRCRGFRASECILAMWHAAFGATLGDLNAGLMERLGGGAGGPHHPAPSARCRKRRLLPEAKRGARQEQRPREAPERARDAPERAREAPERPEEAQGGARGHEARGKGTVPWVRPPSATRRCINGRLHNPAARWTRSEHPAKTCSTNRAVSATTPERCGSH